jgi:hypothetical protein
MTTILKFFRIKSNKFDANYLPPHYDDLSIKSGYLPSYDETISYNMLDNPEKCDIPSLSIKSNFKSTTSTKYSKLIDTLYKMGPKSYIVVDPNVYELEKLAVELAINNHTELTLFEFYRYYISDTNIVSININNKTTTTTKDFVILGFNDIDIKFDGKQNMKQKCTCYSFQIINGKYIASCLHSQQSILLKTK